MLRGLLRDSAIYGASDVAFRLVAFAIFPVYAHALTVEQFGMLELLTVSVALISIVGNHGLNNSLSRFYWDPAVPDRQRPLLVSTGLALIIACTAIMTLVAFTIAIAARSHMETRYEIAWPLIVVGLLAITPAQTLGYLQDVLRLQFAPVKFTVVLAVRNLLAVAVSVILLLAFELGIYGILLGMLIGPLVALPVGAVFARKDLTARVNARYAGQMMSFGHAFIYAGLAYWAIGSLDRWMLVEYSDIANVGWYSIAFKIASVIGFLATAFGQAWIPVAMRVYGTHASPGTVFGEVLSAWCYVLALAAAAVSLFARELLALLTPAQYWQAALPAAVCASAAAVYGTTQVTALGIAFAKRTSLLVVASSATAVVNVALNVMLIPNHGALGAAIASFVSYAALTSLYLYLGQQLYPFRLETFKLLFSAVIIVSAPVAAVLFDTAESLILRIASKAAFLVALIAAGAAVGIWDRRLIGYLRAPEDAAR